MQQCFERNETFTATKTWQHVIQNWLLVQSKVAINDIAMAPLAISRRENKPGREV